MTKIDIYSVRKWGGLYYLFTFTKGGKRCVDWDENCYE